LMHSPHPPHVFPYYLSLSPFCQKILNRLLEKQWGVSLEEERLRVMEEMNLTDCSVLAAIFYTDEIKDGFEDIVDQNLAPENRGW